MATLTLTQVAQFSALELGVLDSGEGLSTQQLADFLFNLNAAIDNRSNDQAEVLAVSITSFNLVANTASYTIGTGATFNIARPVAITAADHVLTVSGETLTTGVEVVNAKEWSAIPDRSSTSLVVRKLLYDRGYVGTPPVGKVYVSPVPSANSALELTTWGPLPQFADATTPLTIPPGYTDWYNMLGCFVMAPQFETQIGAALQARIADEMTRIRNLNAGLIGAPPPASQGGAAASPGSPPVATQ